MRHERGIEALDLHPIIECLETRLAWHLFVSDIAARMGSSYFTLKRYERGAEFPSGKMLLKWVDVLRFELVMRHKKSAASEVTDDLLTDVYEKNYGGKDIRAWARIVIPLGNPYGPPSEAHIAY
jgi:hypothetical protein